MNATVDTAPQTAGRTTTMNELKPPLAPEANMPAVHVGFTSLQSFQLIWRVSQMFASSSIVPQRFQQNPANCAIALEMAHRLGASPLMVMQNLYVVHGSPGWSAKFLIACFNQCGRFTSIKYKMVGTKGKDDWGCIATTTEIATGEKIEGPLIDIALAKKEGWYSKKDRNGNETSKWQSMPEQMLRYRAGAWMINTTAPEISMGLRTADELEDMGALEARRDSAGNFAVDLDTLRASGAGAKEGSGTDQKSPPDSKEWVNKLGNCPVAELEATWLKCVEAFGEDGVPNECDAAYQNRKESIVENAGKQLEL